MDTKRRQVEQGIRSDEAGRVNWQGADVGYTGTFSRKGWR